MIGHVYLPDEFFHRLLAAPVVVLKQPLSWRVARLVQQYGNYPTEELVMAFTRIRKKLGGQHLKAALMALDQNDLATAARIGLVYYDKAYQHYNDRRNARITHEVIANSPHPADIAEQCLALE
ncbi:MAG: hypothetical protein AAGF89_13450 [Bacteroidota bacterium]